MPETWDRQPGESEEAYRAFCVFRDMGPDRVLVDAYRRSGEREHEKGTRGARQTSGRWNAWAADHEWRQRAMAWDHHRSAVAQRAIDAADAANAARWANRLQEVAEADWEVAENLRKKVRMWSAMPPVTRTELTDKDGKRTLVEPVGIQDTERVAKIAQAASQMAYAAIAMALPDIHVDIDEDTATLDQINEAIERLGARLEAAGPAQAAGTHPRIARAG